MSKLVGYLNINGLCISIEDLKNKYNNNAISKIKNKYTIKYHNFITNKYKTITAWYESKDKKYLYLPKGGAHKLLSCKIIDEIVYDIPDGIDISYNYIGTPTYNQNIICNYLEDNIFDTENNSCILKALAGCHIADTPILMYNGNVKRVQDIKINDKIMGDDSTKRTVLKLYKGRDQMYEIQCFNNEKYIVNENHILSLTDVTNNSIIDIPLKQYMNFPTYIKNKLYTYKVPIHFPTKKINYNPYIIGLLFIHNVFNNDTTINNTITLSIENINVVNYIKSLCSITEVKKYKFILNLKNYNNINIRSYIINSREVRLNFLAGIIDSHKTLVCNNKYAIISFNNDIISIIKYLCKSLGYICYNSNDNNKIIYIEANTFEHIPIRNQNKVITKNNSFRYINKLLLSKIKVKYLYKDKYYGFKLDKNNRYVLGDSFIVTHNSGKTFIGFEMIKRLSKKTLIIVPNTYLLEQWYNLLVKLFPNHKIGQYYCKKKIDGDIVVSIIKSASFTNTFTLRKPDKKDKTIITKNYTEFFKDFGFIIYDECHMYCTNTYKRIFQRANVKYILGLSATPDEKIDQTDRLVNFHLGDIVDVEKIKNYKKENIVFTSKSVIVKYNAPDEYSNTYINNHTKLIDTIKIISEIISDPYRNLLLINTILEHFNNNRNIFVFSDRREHLEILYNILIKKIKKDNIFIPEINKEDEDTLEDLTSILYGGSTKEKINTSIKKSLVIFTTYQYSSTGISIDKMDTLILATPRRNNMKQIIGRIFRIGSNMDIERIIIDILDNKSVLKGQLRDRKKAYLHRNSEIETIEIDHTDIN